MFGYITINQMELKVKDYLTYQAYYCGICQCLKKRYGQRSRLVLSYDMTFVSMLLQGLYEPEEKTESIRCVFHPGKKKMVITSKMSDYAADMNLLLAYHNWADDWADDRSIKALLAMKMLKRSYDKVAATYPRQQKSVIEYMKKLAVCEEGRSDNIDEAANLTGEMFGEILVWREDEWSDTLRKLGFSFGKFIYYMDAYDDWKEDQKHGGYNPLLSVSEETAEEILKMMMAEVAQSFEYLPIVEHVEILRNIIYSGVWMKYCQIKKKRQEAAEEKKNEAE